MYVRVTVQGTLRERWAEHRICYCSGLVYVIATLFSKWVVIVSNTFLIKAAYKVIKEGGFVRAVGKFKYNHFLTPSFFTCREYCIHVHCRVLRMSITYYIL